MTRADSLGWAWVGHLLDGGCTPWAEFEGASAAPLLAAFPGAAQLELARRVNAVGARPAVVRRILTTGAPFRGRQEFLVRGVAEVRDYGPVPVDPADVPRQELVRVGVGALAEELTSRVPPPLRARPSPVRRLGGPGPTGQGARVAALDPSAGADRPRARAAAVRATCPAVVDHRIPATSRGDPGGVRPSRRPRLRGAGAAGAPAAGRAARTRGT